MFDNLLDRASDSAANRIGGQDPDRIPRFADGKGKLLAVEGSAVLITGAVDHPLRGADELRIVLPEYGSPQTSCLPIVPGEEHSISVPGKWHGVQPGPRDRL